MWLMLGYVSAAGLRFLTDRQQHRAVPIVHGVPPLVSRPLATPALFQGIVHNRLRSCRDEDISATASSIVSRALFTESRLDDSRTDAAVASASTWFRSGHDKSTGHA